jgi:hypothetical protein
MTYQNDPNPRVEVDPYDARTTLANRGGIGWGAAVIAALVIIGGLIMFGSSDRRTTTAANDRAPITNNVPTQTTPAPLPNNNTPSR